MILKNRFVAKKKKNYTIVPKPASFLKKTSKAKDVVLAKTATGYFIYGGRGRSKVYKTINSIPKKVIEWVESTN